MLPKHQNSELAQEQKEKYKAMLGKVHALGLLVLRVSGEVYDLHEGEIGVEVSNSLENLAGSIFDIENNIIWGK